MRDIMKICPGDMGLHLFSYINCNFYRIMHITSLHEPTSLMPFCTKTVSSLDHRGRFTKYLTIILHTIII